jgi:hypothetical protein
MLLYILLTSIVFAPLALGGQAFHQNPAAILSIQHTIAQYPLSIDSKNFTRLSTVFTDDVFANYSIAAGIFNNLSEIQDGLSAALRNLTTQHSLTTQSINVLSEGHAEATTYVIATHFGIPSTSDEGLLVTVYASFKDKLRVTDDGVWKIFNRLVIFMVCPPSWSGAYIHSMPFRVHL